MFGHGSGGDEVTMRTLSASDEVIMCTASGRDEMNIYTLSGCDEMNMHTVEQRRFMTAINRPTSLFPIGNAPPSTTPLSSSGIDSFP